MINNEPSDLEDLQVLLLHSYLKYTYIMELISNKHEFEFRISSSGKSRNIQHKHNFIDRNFNFIVET